MTTAELDSRILLERTSFLDADERGDYADADKHYKAMDELLEQRISGGHDAVVTQPATV